MTTSIRLHLLMMGALALAACNPADRTAANVDAASASTCGPVRECVSDTPPRQVRIEVDQSGFTPARVSAKLGESILLTFLRTTDATCAREVVFPGLGVRRSLPLGRDVEVRVTTLALSIDYMCPTGMFHGVILTAR